ncbi:Protein of unknown function [Microlunatus flavus]|uniref:DUF2752 domain-containing protein n=1 Tax=Microlunatus flavus TaxID=1036181 RepID=A0A1H9JB89_9ACTN|nr:Protein of unknown function [Microlunatus flavus]
MGPAGVAARAEHGFRPQEALRPLAGFFAAGLGLSALYATTGVGLPCPFRVVTGWDCPLCGGTRMGSALLHGDVGTAFADNALALVGIALLGVSGVLWVLEALGGPAVRPPLALRRLWGRTTTTQRLVAFLAVAAVWTVLRNLL